VLANVRRKLPVGLLKSEARRHQFGSLGAMASPKVFDRSDFLFVQDRDQFLAFVCRLAPWAICSNFLLNGALTLHTAKTHPAHGQDQKRPSTTTEPLPLEPHSVLPELRVGRMDRPGRPQGDNDIVEQYNNPKELALPRAP
jgi:hypothetical protein